MQREEERSLRLERTSDVTLPIQGKSRCPSSRLLKATEERAPRTAMKVDALADAGQPDISRP